MARQRRIRSILENPCSSDDQHRMNNTIPQKRRAQSAHNSQPASNGADRRRSHRQHSRTPAWLSPEAQTKGGAARQVLVTDLSMHGVGFISSQPLEADGVYWIVVGEGPLRASSRLKIVTCRCCNEGGYEIGCEFF